MAWPFISPSPARTLLSVRRIGWLLAAIAAASFLVETGAAQEGRRSSKRRPASEETQATSDTNSSASIQSAGKATESPDSETAPLTLRDVIQFAQESREAVDGLKDFTANFSKAELINNRLVRQTMDMKFRTKPFSVYFRYKSGNEAGRQAIYVEGRFGNNLVVKEVGVKAMVGAINLRLNDPLVLAENRHPVTQAGIPNILETAIGTWEHEAKLDVAEPDIKFFPNARLKQGGVACQAVQVTYGKPVRELKYHIARVYFDKETKLPVRAERFGWPRQAGENAPLIEEYTYSNVKTNVGLTDADFDPRRYGF